MLKHLVEKMTHKQVNVVNNFPNYMQNNLFENEVYD